MSEYPTKEQLKKIKQWNTSEDLLGLLDYVQRLWTYKDYFKFSKNFYRWEMHTGGWSGNEEIISALQENFLFWNLFWAKSERGGHYYFDTSMLEKKFRRELLKIKK